MDTHKKAKTTLDDIFQKLHEKETISKTIQITILNAFQILSDSSYIRSNLDVLYL